MAAAALALAPTRQVDITVSRREVGHLLWQSEGFVDSAKPRSRLRKRAFTRAVSHNYTTRHATTTAIKEADADGGMCSGDGGEGMDADADAGVELYDVEAILGERVQGGAIVYLVKWEGYGPEWNTWEPSGNLATCTVFIAHIRDKLTAASTHHTPTHTGTTRTRTHAHTGHAASARMEMNTRADAGSDSEGDSDPDFNETDVLVDGEYDDADYAAMVDDCGSKLTGTATTATASRRRTGGSSPSKRYLPKLASLVHTPLSTPLKATRPGNKTAAKSREALFNVLKTGSFTPVRTHGSTTTTTATTTGGAMGAAADHTPRRLVLTSPSRSAPLLTGSHAKPRGGSGGYLSTGGRARGAESYTASFRRQLQQQIASQAVSQAATPGTPATAPAAGHGHKHVVHPRQIVFPTRDTAAATAHAGVRGPRATSPVLSPCPPCAGTPTGTPLPSMPATPSAHALRPAHCDGTCHHTNCLCDPNRRRGAAPRVVA